MDETENNNIYQTINIEKEMKTSYIDYAMIVIVGRALPDVRDGLKPVHRRILYAMYILGVTPDKAFRKSARVVGDVLGKYHPHGDSSVYDAMVRMAQDFSFRYPLVDGQGNYGSIDGDSAAAMRYTEAKLEKIAMELLRDINKESVDFSPNFDESEMEPKVLPARFPNLLVNGSTGIAVGMATNIPPHNLGEVIDGTIAYIDNNDITLEGLMKHIKGPDFPTGATILGKSGIRDAYRTGRGRIKMRSKVDVETLKNGRKQLIVREIPYMVNKSRLIEKIADLVKEKEIDGISDIRDESDLKQGIRIVMDLKRDANETIILNQLYKQTQLDDTFGVINLALVGGEPKVLSLKEMIGHYVDHQKEIIVRRTQFDLNKAEARAHILEGLRIALDHIDEVIALIRGSKDGREAKEGLMNRFKLSEIQAQAILDMRLQRLTGLERDKIEEEYKEILALIAQLRAILADEQLVLNIIKEELTEIKTKHGDARRTDFDIDPEAFSLEDLIEEEEVVITMTHVGYVKRITADAYRSQRRGGKGITALSTRENDFVENLYTTTTHHHLLFFSNKGLMYRLRAFEIPEGGRTARGTAIVNLLPLDQDEKITTVIPIKEFTDNQFLVMATRQGMVKKSELTQYESNRTTGIIGINLREEDELIDVRLVYKDAETDVMLGTQKGYAIRFNTEEIRPVGRVAIGVKGIDIRKGDIVVGMDIVQLDEFVLNVSQNGYGKLTKENQYRAQRRGGKGVQTYKVTAKTGDLVGFCVVDREQEIMMINNQGIVIKIETKDISTVGRNTQGVRLMKLQKDEAIATIAKVYREEDDENEEE
ncbi:MAG: DNA gyrase subunit A [Eubacteriaceae bacterium]|nr:DNA gyrase subunit A [Eubacteriaceae bacterium]